MFTIFKEEKVITTGILVFLGLSILVRLLLAGFYHTMIKETDNMATTNNRLLKQCKVKFANCYQLNGGVSNIPVFVDKFLNRTLVGRYACDVLSFQQHFAGRRFQKARDEAEGGGFTAAGGSQQRHKLFVMDVEVQPIQDALTIKFHYDVPQRNDHRVVHFFPISSL